MKKGILVLNAGSSSLKFAVFEVAQRSQAFNMVLRGQVSGIGSNPEFRASTAAGDDAITRQLGEVGDHRQAIAHALDWVTEKIDDMRLLGVGHRVVHGGPDRRHPALVNPELLQELNALSPLAPHHQPHNLAAIHAVTEAAPELAQVACFDTAFHATQSKVARMLPLPASLRQQGLQRYGFHGLSYEYIVDAVPGFNNGDLPQRLIVAHLGNGASVCAIRDGESVATSMGFSTLDGLLMGTRCGGIDPGVLLHLLREQQMDEKALSHLLYNESGLLGVSGISADMQVLLNSDAPAAADAVALFCYTLVRAVGSMAAAMEGVDALVFTGGIGEHAAVIRERVCAQLGWLGIDFDARANAAGDAAISSPGSGIKVWVIPTNEEQVITRHTVDLVGDPAASAALAE
ncbi:MAG: acetate/propionate family kinase [Gammaproteobacteria bacterium]|nr:acetate/propionate family kinase [Gammaproteobacteria bacterium]